MEELDIMYEPRNSAANPGVTVIANKWGSTDGAGGLIRVRTPSAPYVAWLSRSTNVEVTACASARYSRRSAGSVARW